MYGVAYRFNQDDMKITMLYIKYIYQMANQNYIIIKIIEIMKIILEKFGIRLTNLICAAKCSTCVSVS